MTHAPENCHCVGTNGFALFGQVRIKRTGTEKYIRTLARVDVTGKSRERILMV